MRMSIRMHFSIFSRNILVILSSSQRSRWITSVMYQSHIIPRYFRQPRKSHQQYRKLQDVYVYLRHFSDSKSHIVTIISFQQILNQIWIGKNEINEMRENSSSCKKKYFHFYKTMDTQQYEHERSMCRKLQKEQWWCAWWRCSDCGVPLLLEKLKTGIVHDDPDTIRKIRQEFSWE